MASEIVNFNEALTALNNCDTCEEVDNLLRMLNLGTLEGKGFMTFDEALRYFSTPINAGPREEVKTLAMFNLGVFDIWSLRGNTDYYVNFHVPTGSASMSIMRNDKEGLAPVREAVINTFLQFAVIVCPDNEQ